VLNHFYLFSRDYAIKQWAGSAADHSKQDIAAGDRLAKERHEKLKKNGLSRMGIMIPKPSRTTRKPNESTKAVRGCKRCPSS
jgi:hypothetical protein